MVGPSAQKAVFDSEAEVCMTWTIWTDQRGLIHAKVGGSNPGFDEALGDSLSALSPAGQPPALSTYWIDLALARLEQSAVQLLVSGNSTRFIRKGADVVAQSDYEMFPDERMPGIEFINGLQLWRKAIADGIQRRVQLTLPEGVTYWAQRTPFSTNY